MSAHFGPGFFAFLTDLKANNDRAWFQANKARYVDEVESPMRGFVDDVGARLSEISSSYAEGSMFRIYRDTRFSNDKTPFKTAAAAQFRHRTQRKDHSLPGFYLHLSPEHSVGGGGLYRAHPASIGRVRDRIVAEPDEWAEVLAGVPAIQGDALKRPPAGYDPAHRFVDDLKRKDHIVMEQYTPADVCQPEFLDRYVATCASLAPLMRFLTRALDLSW